MNKRRKYLVGLLVFCLLFQTWGINSLAGETATQQPQPYGYSVSFYAGNQGVFTGTEGITVSKVPGENRPEVTYTMRSDRSAITITGLKAGDRVNFGGGDSETAGLPVELLGENSPYYVRGLCKSGYGNDQMAPGSFTVEQDQDYVISYGIRGDMVSYEVRYEDENGRSLALSRPYFGNVGDRPVVAYLYIEGYVPQAYNLTQVLSKNEAENVFTFVYSPVENGEAGGGGSTGGGQGEGEGGVITTIVENGVQGAAVLDNGAGVGAGEEAGTNLPGEEVPLAQGDGPQELINIDEEETPLAFRLGDLDGATNMIGALVVSVSGAAALLVMLAILLKRRKKETS